MTISQADTEAESEPDWGRMSRRLIFLDNDLEREFRAAERNRNLGQARFVLWLAFGILLVFAAADTFVLPADATTFVAWRAGLLSLTLIMLLAATYAPFFRTRWPLLMTLAVHAMTLAAGLTNALVDVSMLYPSGFMLLILAGYLVVPLIFAYCIGTMTTATVVYLIFTAFAEVVDGQVLAQLTLQMVMANVVGVAALHRAERIRRLEHLTARRLDQQRLRYRELLTSILPAPVADRLQRGETVVDEYTDATVLFADIVGFTALAARFRPDQILELFNRIFAKFDELTAEHGLEKIKTIGDSYMVAGGVFGDRSDYLTAMADLALAMQRAASQIDDPDGDALHLRIGIHVGGLTAGVIGQRRFMYDLWGDTVNIASRMQNLGEPDRIQVSDDVRRRLDARYQLSPRGEIAVKGKGRMATWYLLGRTDENGKAAERS
ncbi:MAG: adenylate/guanylate cyclase domain-containing protein [Alphaproteobacteria bacterium]